MQQQVFQTWDVFFCTVMIVDRGQVDLKGFLDIVHRVDEAAIALS